MEDEIVLDENVESTPPEVESERKRNCDACGTEYNYRSGKSKYCSLKCRNSFNSSRRKQLIGSTMQQSNASPSPAHDHRHGSSSHLVTSLKGLDAQSQYIIQHQHQIIADLKADRERLQTRLEQATEKRDELQKKLDRIELEQSFKIAEKSGLNGVLENPVVMEIARHAGPALGEWLMNVVQKPGPAQPEQLTGADLPEEVRTQIQEITTWYSGQPKDIQDKVYGLLNAIAEKDPKHLPNILQKLTISISTNGTVQHQIFN